MMLPWCLRGRPYMRTTKLGSVGEHRVTSISSISSRSISVLFGSNSTQATDGTSTATQTQTTAATGNTDNALKTGGAIGKIIEIVSGMGQSDKLFDMSNAQKAYAADGDYSETATGTGTVVSDEYLAQSAVAGMQELANDNGPKAGWAKAYLAASTSGGITKTDMSTMGVTSTMTETNYYYADGRDKGESGSYNTQGMDQFLQNNVTVKDGVWYDKSGNYASLTQNGTQFTFLTWPTGATSQAAAAQTTTA
jgi:hypothetical protein